MRGSAPGRARGGQRLVGFVAIDRTAQVERVAARWLAPSRTEGGDHEQRWIVRGAARPHARCDGRLCRARRGARPRHAGDSRGEVHVDAIGMQAVGGSAPMRRDTIFRISSMTKPITAVAAMILVEECRLRLDEPVDRLLPELADRQVLKRLDGPLDDTVPAKRPITRARPADLPPGLRHRSWRSPDAYPIQKAVSELQIGIGAAEPVGDACAGRVDAPPGDAAADAPAGRAWMYNTGSDVLGVLIARAAGQPLETFLRERIFEPLGMQRHRLQRAGGQARPARDQLLDQSRNRGARASSTRPRAASGAARPPSRPAPAGWSRPSTTTWPSARCC